MSDVIERMNGKERRRRRGRESIEIRIGYEMPPKNTMQLQSRNFFFDKLS